MKKRIIFILLILCVVVLFLFRDVIFRTYGALGGGDVSYLQEVVSGLSRQKPLLRIGGNLGSELVESKIFDSTNNERIKEGEEALRWSDILAKVAKFKAQDILERQYFEHVAPTGESVGDNVKSQGYEYILVGENLAMGNFDSEDDLLSAWMSSVGHRKNILNSSFQEIGVASVVGKFGDKEVSVIVQIFAVPKNACGRPDESGLDDIDNLRSELALYEISIEEQKILLTTLKDQPTKYNETVDDYNALVRKYKKQAIVLNEEIDNHNIKIRTYNECVSKFE